MQTALRPCARCQRPSRGPCPYCRERRPSARARGYSPAWDKYSIAWLARFPWCGMRADGQFHADESLCVQEGQRRPAAVTDHIVPLVSGGSMFDPANHQSLCTRCNTVKSL